jgi:hypothetical protein
VGRTVFVFAFLYFIPDTPSAQTVRTPVADSYTRVTTYSAHSADVFCSNQAALASLKSFSAGVYGERRFMLADLSLYKAAFALPTSSGVFGFQANYFGSASYNESQVGLAYGRKLGKIDIGVQFNYYNFKASGYGTASSINFEAGLILHVTNQLETGVHIYNPTGTKIGKQAGEKLPSIYSAGFGYDVSEKFFMGAEFQKTEDRQVDVSAGLQYRFDEKLFARGGIASATNSFYFGFGFLVNGFRIDVTASVHPQLGVTPALMLLYSSAKK